MSPVTVEPDRPGGDRVYSCAVRLHRVGIAGALLPLLLASLLPWWGCGVPADEPLRARTDPDARRRVAQGEVVGFRAAVDGGEAHVWRALPFAAPPVGERRWRAPAPPSPWADTREALEQPPPCAQPPGLEGGANPREPGVRGAEDCLYLNVFAPAYAPDAVPSGADRLPVMVWIHGGGNSTGTLRIYDASGLAARRRVVVVTLQYRLGPLGWLHHPALAVDPVHPDDASGNYGTLDLVQALRWLRENVAAFGGDPGNVTVFGESAGGANVFSLLLTPRARGLFHRAIVQSGGLRSYSVAEASHYADDPEPGNPYSSRESLVRLLLRDGTAPDAAAARAHLAALGPAAVARYLRSRPVSELLAAYDESSRVGMLRMPRIIRDGAVIPAEPPLAVLSTPGAYNTVPTIVGTNRDEMKLFFLLDGKLVRSVGRMPLWIRDEAIYEAANEYASGMWKVAAVDEPASALRRAQGPSVWAYRFDWDEEPDLMWLDLSHLVGAAHAVEIPFVFGLWENRWLRRVLVDEERTPARLDLADAMQSYWTRFALAGDPGSGRDGDLPPWTAWQNAPGEAPRLLLLDTPADGGLRMSPLHLTAEGLVERAAGDPRIPEERRCALFVAMAGRSPRWTPADVEARGCL